MPSFPTKPPKIRYKMRCHLSSKLGFPACESPFSDNNITRIQMSEPLNESWGELASFIMYKNSVDIGALNRLFLLAMQTHQEEALFSRQVENFIQTISAQAKSKPLQHSQALALISLDALLYNMYKVVRGNEGFKPASSSFYGYMSMSHMSGEFSELSNLNQRQPKRIIALVQHLANSESVSRKVKLILDRANNKDRNRRYGENLIETMEYILTKEKSNKENFIKLWSKLVISSGPSKGKAAFDYRRVNEIIFSNQLNKITRLLTEGNDELHFALIRIYYAENEEGERKQFQGREHCGNDMLHNLHRYYVDSFEDQNDLFEESKHPLFRFIRNYLILYFCPFLQKFHAMVVRFGLKGDVEQAWTFYKSNQALLKEEVMNLIRSMPVELVKLLHSLSCMIEQAFRIQRQSSVNLVKKLLFYSFLCSQSVIEDILPQVDPAKYSNIYNHVLNLFFQSSLRKFADLPPQKLHLISSLVEEVSSQTDARIISPNSQVLEEELSEPTELCFSIKDPILNYDYQLIWNAQEKIEFTPKDMKKFAMSKEGERVVESPVYKHFRKEASILEQTQEGEADIATWMSVGGSRDWNNTRELKRDRRSMRERLQGLNTLRGDKIRELNLLKSQFQYYLP